MEIEKKFIPKRLPENYRDYPSFVIEQGYLASNPTIRIRRMNEDYILTYKSRKGFEKMELDSKVCACEEIELPLTKECYQKLIKKIDGSIVEKVRYKIPLEGGLVAELDIFGGKYDGLVIVEVEFESEKQALGFETPDWFGEDVSADIHYKNFYLAGA